MCAKPYVSFLRCFLRFFLCGFLRCFLRCFLRFFSASMRINAFITCLVHVFFKSLNLRVHAARAAIFAGVQPSRLSSSLPLFVSSSLCLFDYWPLTVGSPSLRLFVSLTIDRRPLTLPLFLSLSFRLFVSLSLWPLTVDRWPPSRPTYVQKRFVCCVKSARFVVFS